MPVAETRPRNAAVRYGILLAAVVLVSVNLRPGASSLGPVLEEVRDGLGMSDAVAGALTGLPGLCFGVVGALAVGFARRVGMTVGIATGLVAVAGGLLLRVTTDSVGLFLVLTVVALAGMAVGNVLVPAWIKVHGHAVAGGSDIALCCDLIVMAEDARIGYMPARVWGCPTTAMWVYRLGAEKAKRMLLTGDTVDGREAERMGLVLKAVPAAQLDDDLLPRFGRALQILLAERADDALIEQRLRVT